MSRFFRLFRRHREDERGAVLVLTAASMVLILGAGALGVDVGFTVYGSRTAQAMADTAALDLAQDIATMDSQPSNAAVSTYVSSLLAGVDSDNGSNAYLYGVPGVYQNGQFTTLAGGCAGTVFLTPPLACNAIEVWSTQSVPQIFWGGFNSLTGAASNHNGGGCTSSCTPPPGAGCSAGTCTPPPGTGCTGSPCTPPTTCTGTCATWQPKVGFSIGSYLASINTQQTGVLNVLLAKLGTANVTAVGYQGLANTYVSLNDLITASGGVLTTSNVLTTTLTAAQWLNILNTAVNNQTTSLSCGSSPTPLPCEASTGLSALNFNASTSAELCQLISINGSTCSSGTLSTSALNSSVDLLQMLTAEAELANGSNALDVTSALSLPGVSDADLHLTLIQPAQSTYGAVGSDTTAGPPCPSSTKTCAYTAQVSSDLQLNVIGSGLLDIPLSAGVGYATLNSASCSNMVFQNATINVTTTAASGTVTLAGSPIATLSVAGVTNKAGTFSTVPPTASSVSAGTNPRNFGSKTPALTYTGLSALSPVFTLLTSTLPPVLGPILQVSGAAVGGAQVTAYKDFCDAVSLVS